MLKEKIYKLLIKVVEHPENKDYVSNRGIYWASLGLAFYAALAVIHARRKIEYPIITTIWLSLAMFIGTFIIVYGSLKFGNMIYKKVKNIETKKTIVILLILAIILIFILPFFMVHVLGYK